MADASVRSGPDRGGGAAGGPLPEDTCRPPRSARHAGDAGGADLRVFLRPGLSCWSPLPGSGQREFPAWEATCRTALGGGRGLFVRHIDGGLLCRPYQGRIGLPGPSIWAARGLRERTLLEEGTMAEIERISVADARNKVQGKQALLVCAYPDEAKFRAARLDGAISLASFEARTASLPKGQEIIFYCA